MDVNHKEFIESELKKGVSARDIKQKLNVLGVDIFEVLGLVVKDKNFVLDYISMRFNKGNSFDDITKELKEKFNVNSEEKEQYAKKMRRNGKFKKTAGIILVIISLLIFIFYILKLYVSLTSIVIFGTGMYLWNDGNKKINYSKE